MASEWARKKAEEILNPEGCIHDDSCDGPYGEEPCDCWVAEVREEIAAALDEARAEGAMLSDRELYRCGFAAGTERERWECHRIAAETPDECGEYWRSCKRCGAHIADAISARGPMRGPEEE